MQKYIYGLDLSMSCTGVVVFDENATPIFVGSVQTKDKDSHGVRLKKIADYLLELKEKYPPSKVILERGFSRFNTSTQVTYRTHGVANYLFYDCEQIYYPPKKVKAAILSGDSSKKDIQDAIKIKYPNVQFSEIKLKKGKGKEENKDESDAFAVGLTYFILEENMDIRFEKVKKERKTKAKSN
jgi:Holliday junction resolvasome RuvABC endonuclease subunit